MVGYSDTKKKSLSYLSLHGVGKPPTLNPNSYTMNSKPAPGRSHPKLAEEVVRMRKRFLGLMPEKSPKLQTLKYEQGFLARWAGLGSISTQAFEHCDRGCLHRCFPVYRAGTKGKQRGSYAYRVQMYFVDICK